MIMSKFQLLSFGLGFILLFIIYHFPAFFPVFWITAIFKIGFLIVAFFLARYQGWKGLGGYGLGFTKGWVSNLIIGVFCGIVFFGLSFLASIALGYENIVTRSSIEDFLTSLPLLLLMTAVPSVAEDILTRGYLYSHLKFIKPTWWILLSSVVYVLNHVWRLNDGIEILVYLFILGLVLATAVWATKFLWLAFGIHWGANIMFESINSLFQITTTSQREASNWILASSWMILLAILIVLNKKTC